MATRGRFDTLARTLIGVSEQAGPMPNAIDRWLLVPVALVLLGAPVVTGQSGGSDEPSRITVIAQASDCPEERELCYHTENASGSLEPGEEVTVTFRNQGQTDHSLYVANGSRADDGHRDTPASAALANTGEVEPGSQTNLTVTAPNGDALYLWCEVSDHEAQGMWTTIPIGTSNENATGPNQGADRTPLGPIGAMIAIVSGVALVARARR